MATSSFVAVFMPGMILPATSTRKRGGVFFYGAERESCAAGRRRRTVRTSAGLGLVNEGIGISIARTSR